MSMSKFNFLKNIKSLIWGFFYTIFKSLFLVILLCSWGLVFWFGLCSKISLAVNLKFVLSCILCSGIAGWFAIEYTKRIESRTENRKINESLLTKNTLLSQNEAKEKEMQLKDAEIERLQNQIALLKGTQLSMQNFQKILELALVEVPLIQNDVQQIPLDSKKCKGFFADEVAKEALVIQSHELNAKFGFDLNQVLIKKNDNKLFIYLGEVKYIGSDKIKTEFMLSEIRQIKRKNTLSEKQILSDVENISLASQKEKEVIKDWQNRLSQGLETGFLNSTVEKLAQQYMEMIFAPLQMPIEFIKTAEPDSLSISDFLHNEIQNRSAELTAQTQAQTFNSR